ncbi:hypothetical protein M0R04_11210 [Candidatus Dojkabacteria bacterium]|jgi:hypothetical protein|nr:hypothetical protein [Candidatus Dojkabacteria bacterium]
MINIQVRVDDRSFNKTMTNIAKNSGRVGDRMLWGMAKRCETEIKHMIVARNHDSSGNLRRRTRARKVSQGKYVVSMPWYIVPLEDGTSPHAIAPTQRARLWARKHGMTFIEMWSNINSKGTKPHPFVSEAVMKAKIRFENEVIRPTMKVWLRSKGTTLINT